MTLRRCLLKVHMQLVHCCDAEKEAELKIKGGHLTWQYRLWRLRLRYENSGPTFYFPFGSLPSDKSFMIKDHGSRKMETEWVLTFWILFSTITAFPKRFIMHFTKMYNAHNYRRDEWRSKSRSGTAVRTGAFIKYQIFWNNDSPSALFTRTTFCT